MEVSLRLEDRAGDGRITPLSLCGRLAVVAPSNTKVSPIPLSNCFLSVPLVLSFEARRCSAPELPGDGARLGETRFTDWLKKSAAAAVKGA